MVNIKISETLGSKNQIIGAIPTGTIVPTILNSIPSGWLECDGSEVLIGSSGSTYYNLSQQLGTTYGSLTNGSGGAGSTHFKLPNLKSSYLIPKISTDNVNSGGSNIHQHLVTATATSSNNGNAHNHNISQNGTGGDAFDHSHSGSAGPGAFTGSNPGQVNKTGTTGSGQGSGAAHIHLVTSSSNWGSVAGNSNHSIASLGISSSSVDNHSHSATISGNSSNTESFPQSYVVRYLIKV